QITSTSFMSYMRAIDKVMEIDQALIAVRREKDSGGTVVFTNGCFDVLHVGHIRYLEQASELGTLLVIGVNSDESVKALKGPSRPVNGVADRCEVLAALSSTGIVV